MEPRPVKILIAEDIDALASGIISKLKSSASFSFDITKVDTCDEAIEKIKEAAHTTPFDLAFIDLHFKKGKTKQHIDSGEDLLVQIKKLNLNIKIIVYSIINHPATVDFIVNHMAVDGYITKGRKSLNEILPAVMLILDDQHYFSKEILDIIRQNKNALTITRSDRIMLKSLYLGHRITELPEILKAAGIKVYSHPTVEKRIKLLREHFNAKTNIQMVALAKEKGYFLVSD